METDYSELYTALGCHIPASELQHALTHRSYAYEHHNVPTNERLEHLGDAVLQLVISEILYHTYPDSTESTLTKMRANIVNTRALAATARSMGIGKYVFLGNGEENQGGRDKDSILADTLEAIVGVVYCAKGYHETFMILSRIFHESIKHADARKYRTDWKTPLQEILAQRKLPVARYEVERFGPQHASTFIAKVYINEEFYGEGKGSNRRSAEQDAAQIAWYKLTNNIVSPYNSVN